ncbi:MAG TPA: FAD-dependent oxidoreductase [Jiangellaceae bacterium]|nr:FAD-dependent oxidoreductase [Jiangellaceae bacterium]
MSGIENVELLVVGGGKAGKSLAVDRAKAGVRVAMVERGMIGGTCINVACIPTKSLVTSARVLRTARRAAEYGVSIKAEPVIDLALLRAHKEGVVDGLVSVNHKQFLDSGMDFVIGQARFVADRTVEVELADGGRRTIRGQKVVVNTGTRPLLPPIPGLAEAGVLTSNSLLDLTAMPARLVVVGGGTVGVEFAQMFATFGATVTLIEAAPQLLGREDADIAAAVADIFTSEGIDIRLGRSVTQVDRAADGTVTISLDDGSGLRADDVLVAVGRSPVTEDLDLSATGVEVDSRGFVVADDRLRTTAEGVWTAGDVAGSPQFTHVSWDDYRILKANMAGGSRSTTARLIPYTVFITPELGRVGLTEAAARAAGRRIRTAKLPVAAIPRARTFRNTTGVWTAVVDADSDQILGAALLGPEAGEAVSVVQMAMLGMLPYGAVRDAVISHPTMAEGLNLLFATLTP